jgi:hypothetical protein
MNARPLAGPIPATILFSTLGNTDHSTRKVSGKYQDVALFVRPGFVTAQALDRQAPPPAPAHPPRCTERTSHALTRWSRAHEGLRAHEHR